MSKTFKSAVTKSGNRTLLVSADIGMDAGFFLEVQDEYEGNFPICFNSDTAPALALAILEAAGFESPYYNLDDAVHNLRQHVEREAQHAAEAEAQAKLEAEALELLNCGIGATFKTWPEAVRANQPSVPNWLAVARKARELGGRAEQ